MTKTRQGPPVDGGWGWMVVLASGLSGFCMIGTAKSFGIIADELKTYFESPQYMVALVFGVSAAVYTFAAPLSLVLGERFTQRKVVMIGGLVGFLGMSLSSLCFSLVYIICTFGICFGIGNGFLYGNTLVMIGKYFRKRRSFASGLALAGSSIGQFALPPLIQYLINTYTIKGALLLLGGIYFNITGFGSFLRPLSYYGSAPDVKDVELNDDVFSTGSVQHRKYKSGGSIKGDNPDDTVNDKVFEEGNAVDNYGNKYHQTSSWLDLPASEENHDRDKSKCCKSSCTIPQFLDFSVLKNRTCLLYSFVMFFMFFGYFNFILFLPSIASSRGIQEYKKAYLVSICGVSDLVARVLFGFVSDFKVFSRYIIICVCSLVLGVNILVYVWTEAYWKMALQSGIYGFFGGGYITLVPLVLIDFVGIDLLPKALAPVLFLQGMGAAIGQVFLGWIRDLTGNFAGVLMICGISNLIGGLAILFYPLAQRRERARTRNKSTSEDSSPS